MQRRFLVPTLVIVAVLAALIWNFSAEDRRVSCGQVVPRPSIVAFGDSLVEGVGASQSGGFVSLVSARSGISIENLGKAGDTTAQAKERLSSALSRNPDVALVLLGGNDALRRVPLTTTEANLDEIIASFKERGAVVVLLGVVGGLPFQDPYPDMYERLAEKHDVVYVANVLSGLIGRSEYMSDAVHPNDQGYARIAERVVPALEEACGRLAD